MLSLMIATLGDVPTAIIAGAGLVLGVLIMARGGLGGSGEAVAAAPAPGPPVAAPLVPAVAEAPGEPATTFRHGTIKVADEPQSEPAPAPDEPAPAPPPLPEFPKTTFRQGTIRMGGVERGRREL